MKTLIKNSIYLFLIVFAIDLLTGLILMPFDIGGVIWPLLHYPVFLVFPFNYLIACSYYDALYLWPLHTASLVLLIYALVILVKHLAGNKSIRGRDSGNTV